MKKPIMGAVAALFAAQPIHSSAWASSLEADINISKQTMTVYKDGFPKYQWKVSTARNGYVTPVGRYTAKSAEAMHRSRKYHNSPMPYSVFYNGGYAVHGTYETARLGRPASHGCVRLHPEHAEIFYQLTRSVGLNNTKIVISE